MSDWIGFGVLVWKPGVREEFGLVFGFGHPDRELGVGKWVLEGRDGGLADSPIPRVESPEVSSRLNCGAEVACVRTFGEFDLPVETFV